MISHRIAVVAFAILLAGACLLPRTCFAQGVPIPQGIRIADQNEEKTQRGIEPPVSPAAQKLSAADIKQQSDELLALAQQVHSDALNATQGLLSKDLKEKLKRLEKLTKQLRQELVP